MVACASPLLKRFNRSPDGPPPPKELAEKVQAPSALVLQPFSQFRAFNGQPVVVPEVVH